MARDIQTTAATDIGSRSKVHRRTVAKGIVRDVNASAVGARLKVYGVASRDSDISEEFVRAGTEISGASGRIGADFDTRSHDAPPPDVLKAPAPLIATVRSTLALPQKGSTRVPHTS